VDCSKQNLLSIPANLPINTTDLDLSGNLIQNLTTETLVPVSGLSHLINLRKLSLSYNSITSIQGTVFQGHMFFSLPVKENGNMNSTIFKLDA
jgi:Leucine-rich repeat (LRR) protein